MLAFSVMTSSIAFAADASAVETITHLEKALAEVNKSDFNAALQHLKTARSYSDKVAASTVAKEANSALIQAIIKVKGGEKAQSTEQLNKSIELYKTL